MIFLIIIPFLGVLCYLIANGDSMAERSAQAERRNARSSTTTCARSPAPTAAAVASTEIERAKALLDSGAITPAEFSSLKAKPLT